MAIISNPEMEYAQTKAEYNSGGDSWSSSTNWTISHGSIEDSITFESSDSPIDSESTHISPLILHQPSPDSGPCEIKLCFTQKHEIRQVYVRSTARVYEIYYAPTLQSDNEYLCTVRCSIAERDGEFLQANGIEVVTPQYLKDYVGKPTEGRVTAEAKLCAREDDWVEVKVPDGNRASCLQKHTTGNERRSIEDFYEATAEISDADPCMSLIIRFLSLPNKDSICIDEVYIFGDPIDSNEVETPAAPMENQASSFMAMLVPTLLQLSKSGISQKQQVKDVFDSQRKENEVEIAVRTSDFADASKENEQEKRMGADHMVQLDVIDEPVAKPTHSQPLIHQDLSRENHNISTTSNDASQDRIAGAIEQLLDRVSRIENICLRFEEKMVNPMNSMEMRLQRLEQQVETLAKNSQFSGVVSCTRITAPSFTCSESNSSSLYNDGSEYRSCGASELEKKDLPCNKLSEPSDDMPVSSNPSHVLPNLVISAPEFSCGEDEEENDTVESLKVSSQEKQKKQVLSIDDALAAALSGFLSTSHVLPPDEGTSEVIASGSISEEVNEKNEFSESTQSASVIAHNCTLEGNDNDKPSKYTQILAISAPDFTEEEYEFENANFIIASSAPAPELSREGNTNNEIASPSTGSQDFVDLNRSKSMDNTSSIVASVTVTEQEKFLHENVQLKEISGIIGSKDHPYEQESICRSQDNPTACPSDQDDKVSETNVRDSTNEPQMNFHNLENAAESEEHDASKGSNMDVMQNVCEYLRPTLDFDIPILDVKFTANEDGDTKFSLEVLLGDTTDVNVDESADNAVTGEGTTSTDMDDEESPKCSAGDSNTLVDFGIYAADTFTSSDDHSNPSISSHQEVVIGLI